MVHPLLMCCSMHRQEREFLLLYLDKCCRLTMVHPRPMCCSMHRQKGECLQGPPAAAPSGSVQLHKDSAAQQRASGWAAGLKEAMAAAGMETPAARSTIIYASRTHSQLAQVMGELKNTSYRHCLRTLHAHYTSLGRSCMEDDLTSCLAAVLASKLAG